jgi:hypothetical protein
MVILAFRQGCIANRIMGVIVVHEKQTLMWRFAPGLEALEALESSGRRAKAFDRNLMASWRGLTAVYNRSTTRSHVSRHRHISAVTGGDGSSRARLGGSFV